MKQIILQKVTQKKFNRSGFDSRIVFLDQILQSENAVCVGM